MKLIILLLTLVAPLSVFANCPMEISLNETTFCAKLNWLSGEVKKQGEFQGSEKMSPYLNPMVIPAPKIVYSRLEIILWDINDPLKTSIEIKDLLFFPWMNMKMGSSHGATSSFQWNSENQSYELSQMNFHRMAHGGCWTLRWTTDPNSLNKEGGQFLTKIIDYSNLKSEEISEIESQCTELIPESSNP